MEIIFRNIPLARSGHSDKRGHLSLPMFCMIPANTRSKNAIVHRGDTLIGRVENLTFIDLHNGMAELRGDIILDCSFATVVKLAFDEVYPVISISCDPNGKGNADYYLKNVSLDCREEREFEDQQPLDLSELRDLVNCIAEKEAPKEARSDSCFNITEWNKEEYQHRAGVFMRIYNKQNSSLPFIVKSIIDEEYEYIGVRENKFPERTMLTIISDFIKIKEAREIEVTDFIKIYEDIHRHIKNDVNSRLMSIIFNERLTI